MGSPIEALESEFKQVRGADGHRWSIRAARSFLCYQDVSFTFIGTGRWWKNVVWLLNQVMKRLPLRFQPDHVTLIAS